MVEEHAILIACLTCWLAGCIVSIYKATIPHVVTIDNLMADNNLLVHVTKPNTVHVATTDTNSTFLCTYYFTHVAKKTVLCCTSIMINIGESATQCITVSVEGYSVLGL